MARSWLTIMALVVCSIFVGIRSARACKCAPPGGGAFVTSPYVDPSHGLELRAQAASLRCEGPRRAPQCHYDARYEIANPSGESRSVPAVVVGSEGTAMRVTVNGAAAPSRSPSELDQRAFEHARQTQMYDEEQSFEATGLVLELGPNATVEVTVQTPVVPTEWACDCGFLQIERRHIVVSRDMEIEYHVDHRRSFGLRGVDEQPVLRTTEIPLRWSTPNNYSVRSRSIRRGHRIVQDSPTPSPSETWNIEARPTVAWGGPIAAVGVGWRKDPGLLLRAGWEIARPAWLVGSLAVETDARTHVELVPTAELTLPRWSSVLSLFPAPGVGVGAPVELVPTVRAGVRTHLSLSWHVLSVLGVIDVYPTQRGVPGKLYGGLMFQVGI